MGNNKVLGGGGFHHIAMKVKDFDKTVQFYRDVLGMTPFKQWGQDDSRAVMLDSGDGSCLEIFAGGSGEPKPEGAFMHLAFNCADVKTVIERVRQAGMTVTMETKDLEIPSSPPYPVRIAFFKGPEGELVELFQTR